MSIRIQRMQEKPQDSNKQGATCGQRPHHKTEHIGRQEHKNGQNLFLHRHKGKLANSREQRGLNSTPRSRKSCTSCTARSRMFFQTACRFVTRTRLSNASPLCNGSFVNFRHQMLSPSCLAQHTCEVARDAVLHVWCRVNREVPDP